jgi:NitT/TauT family transport system permease protein
MPVSYSNGTIAILLVAGAAILVVSTTRLSRLGELRVFAGTRYSRFERAFLTLAGFMIVAGLWYGLAALRPTGYDRVPSPSTTASAAAQLAQSGELLREAWTSLRRVTIGWTLAMLAGTLLGLLAGTFAVGYYTAIPFNSFLRYVPPTAFVTLLIVYFGIDESYKYAVVFAGLFFFVVQMVVDAIEDIDRRYVELALTSGFESRHVFAYVVVPAIMPRLVDIARINLSAAWTFVVVAEVVGAETGLGHLLAVSQRFNRVENLYVGILMFGVIGLLSDRVLQILGRVALPWYKVHHTQ